MNIDFHLTVTMGHSLALLLISVACVASGPIERDVYPPMENPDLFEGDILLSYDQMDRNSVLKENRWPNGVIPYEMAPDMAPHEKDIRKVMDYIQKVTCITFRNRTSEDKNYVRIFNGKGCYSNMGTRGGEQVLSLNIPKCIFFGVILHELSHTIGFFHEHSRYDRDDYVDIHWENIQEKFKGQFWKLKEKEADRYNSFDYGSIMLYGEMSFTKDLENGLKTITAKKPGVKLEGSRNKTEYSDSDIYRIKQMYDC